MSTNFKIGDAVKCIEGYYAPHINGRLGSIVKIDGTDVPYKIELDNGERFWATKVELVTPAKREPKVGDKIISKRTESVFQKVLGDTLEIKEVYENTFLAGSHYHYNIGHDEQYELLPDYADDPKIQQYERAIQTARQQIAYAEGEIAARKAELDELAKPKPDLSDLEKQWLKKHGDCGVVYDAVKQYGSLEKAYPSYSNRVHKCRAWAAVMTCSTEVSVKLMESGINPFILQTYKSQLKALESEVLV